MSTIIPTPKEKLIQALRLRASQMGVGEDVLSLDEQARLVGAVLGESLGDKMVELLLATVTETSRIEDPLLAMTLQRTLPLPLRGACWATLAWLKISPSKITERFDTKRLLDVRRVVI